MTKPSEEAAPGLSMKFLEESQGVVLIDATPEQKQGVVAVLQKSMSIPALDVPMLSLIPREDIQEIIETISAQAANGNTLRISQADFRAVQRVIKTLEDRHIDLEVECGAYPGLSHDIADIAERIEV